MSGTTQTEVVFAYPEVLAIGGAAVVVIVAFSWIRSRRTKKSQPTPDQHAVSNVAYRHAQAKQFRRSVKNYYRLTTTSVVLSLLLTALLLFISARPQQVRTIEPEKYNRDIMLCLDVSGSMVEVDAEIVDTFIDLARSFKGERIGLTMFDSSAVAIFPLTDDYRFVDEQLKTLKAGLEGRPIKQAANYFDGTVLGQGSSLVGDGLASCTMGFDRKRDRKRARSIIFATDNQVNGGQIVTLPKAGSMAKKRGVQVYGINPFDYTSEYSKDEAADEMREISNSTGGTYHALKSDDAVDRIVEGVTKREASRIKSAPQIVKTDRVESFLLPLAIVAFLWVAASWRLKE